MLCLLYHEAKKNVLSGRYPFTQDECDSLAGIQILITDIEQRRETRLAMEPLEDSLESVSYTHLTLPTILRV